MRYDISKPVATKMSTLGKVQKSLANSRSRHLHTPGIRTCRLQRLQIALQNARNNRLNIWKFGVTLGSVYSVT